MILSDDVAIFLVHQSVVENKIPVVFVEDTGGCCDLFLNCYQLYHDYHYQAKLTDPTTFVLFFESLFKAEFRLLVKNIRHPSTETNRSRTKFVRNYKSSINNPS